MPPEGAEAEHPFAPYVRLLGRGPGLYALLGLRSPVNTVARLLNPYGCWR